MKKKLSLILAAVLVLTGCGAEEKPEPASVIVEMADMNAIADTPHDECSIEGAEPRTSIVFRTSTEIMDFTVLGLIINEVGEDGTLDAAVRKLYTQEHLTPDSPLVVHLTFYGDLPTYGISYVDTDGETVYKTVEISGEDGSLILNDLVLK